MALSYADPIFLEAACPPKAEVADWRQQRRTSGVTRKQAGPVQRGDAADAERPGSGDKVRSAGRLIAEAPKPKAKAQAKTQTVRSSSTPATAAKAVPSPSSILTAARDRPRALEPAMPEPVIARDRQEEEVGRANLVKALATVPIFHPGDDPRAFHGRAFRLGGDLAPEPRCVWSSDKKPRQNSPDWLTASEYADQPEVFREKVKCLAALLFASRRTMAYTGAGLSVAAGIGMAAVGSKGGAGTGMGVATAGEPTLAHCVMAELNRQGLLHGWVQQNHDGLPQKAGYKQEDINEIHGSWFDPSNPVVKYSGSLRGDLFEDMEDQAQEADLVLVLGTSLTGLNADQCVTETARRSTAGAALGSVIISPQKTAQDGKASLRIFGKSDDVMKALAAELGLGPRAVGRGRGIRCSADLFPKESRVLVPYDRNGQRSNRVKTYWDLSKGQRIRISSFNNLKGAHQPQDKGLTSETVGTVGGRDEKTCSISLVFSGTNKRIGIWWLETAMRGGVEYLPVVNVNAEEMPA
eukprot:TRINITY_DN50093_c0_g1_i1.p1 TRINITY_DN50093_c0_g1~~TRINITY_DN50093_c0_g1_i1.p1  ORF type:complete len:523 (+),score=102.99 TRINITY_DN50093_c0_g1_i1:63-1631(+)